MAKSLQDKVAIITGGASGIGENTARLFVRNGAKVVIADVQDQLGQKVCESISSPESISYMHCDVTKEDHVQTLVEFKVSKYGKLDLMFANAAIPGKAVSPIIATQHEDLKRVFEVNVFGAFFCAKHAAKEMIPSKKGSIIFTSSTASVTNGTVPHAYTASKHAIVGLTKNLSVELGKHGIRVNCVSPFGVATPMLLRVFGASDKGQVEDFVSEIANLKGEKVEADDVAEAVTFLASDAAKYVSGQNLVIDGGYSLTNVAIREALKKQTFS